MKSVTPVVVPMFVAPSLDVVRHALHRSRIRASILLALLQLAGPATAAELARLARTNARGIKGALYGDGRRYKMVDALIVLGLVATEVREGKVLYVLTPAGQAAARAWQRETMAELARQPRVRA